MMEQPKTHQKLAMAVFLAEEANSVVITALNSTFVWLELPLIWFIWEKTAKDCRVESVQDLDMKPCHCQMYQNYEQSRQKLGTILENRVS